LSTGTLDFGEVDPTGGPASKTVLIYNVGNADLNIESVSLTDGEQGFSVSRKQAGVVSPNEELPLTITFSPESTDLSTDMVVIASDDPDEPITELSLFGSRVPLLQVSPEPVNFGDTIVGCTQQQEFSLTNTTSSTIKVVEIGTPDDKAFSLDDAGLPWSVEPLSTLNGTAWFQPVYEGLQTATVGLTTDFSTSPTLDVTMIGTGRSSGQQTDVVKVGASPIDFLFFFDQSGPTDDELEQLREDWPDFVETVVNQNIDWQLIVVNDDDGCNRSGLITPDTKDAEAVWRATIATGGGSKTEAGLTVVERGMEQAAGGCNAGWLRPGSIAHAIMLSDEWDQSSDPWDEITPRIVGHAGNAGAVGIMLSAIAGDMPNGCSSADPGIGYYQAVRATGGGFYSICSHLGPHIRDIAIRASETLLVIPLSDGPIEGTLSVAINETPTEAWSYASESNAVTLEEPVEHGEKVAITYVSESGCE